MKQIGKEIIDIAQQVGLLLQKHNLMLTTAESCTGGQVAQAITCIPGSAQWFERGFVTYSNTAKQEMLDVPETTLNSHGAVSVETAQAMAEGALQHSHTQVSIAITGIAGPSGGTSEKPVGTICFAWAKQGKATQTARKLFPGNREEIRNQATQFCLQQLLKFI